jgi:hypothetical protein
MYRPRKRNSGFLWVLIVLAVGYAALLQSRYPITGVEWLDASIGVVFGLFVGSRGAAPMVDKTLFGHVIQRQGSKRSEALWLALNMFVLLIGCGLIFVGVVQFTRVTTPGPIPPVPRR